MEEIILNKASCPVTDYVLKKKIILYNDEQKMLIFKDDKYIKLPKEEYLNNVKIDSGLEQSLSVNFEDEKLIQLVSFISYYNHFKNQNNKLTRISRKVVNEYYAYNIEFTQNLTNKILDSEYVLKKEYLPYIVYINEFLKSNYVVMKEDIEAVKKLQKKLKYEII